MTELEKMLNREWYDAGSDPELLAMREKAEELVFRCNQTPPGDKQTRRHLLQELFCHMDPSVEILSPVYTDYGCYCRIGAGTWINRGCYLMDGGTVTIGSGCFIGPFCGFYTAQHPLNPETRKSGLERALPIVIGDDVWLGASVTVLPGVTIGSGSTIGAGSVVTGDIPEGVVAAGNPCRVIRDQEDPVLSQPEHPESVIRK